MNKYEIIGVVGEGKKFISLTYVVCSSNFERHHFDVNFKG